MPDTLQAISDALPFTYAYDALAKVAADDVDARLWLDVGVLAGCIVLALTSGRRRCGAGRRDARRRVRRHMEILGLVFAGSATERRSEMARFTAEVLGLEPAPTGGVDADMFALPDGAFFAVAGPREMGDTSRTIGFLVADVAAAITELRAAGVEVGEPAANDRHRYVHFRAPDGKLYELVEARDSRRE